MAEATASIGGRGPGPGTGSEGGAGSGEHGRGASGRRRWPIPVETADAGQSRPARLRDAPRPSATRSSAGSPWSRAAVDLVLGLAKIGGGFLAQSQSLVADGVHSLSDLVTDSSRPLRGAARRRQARRRPSLWPRANSRPPPTVALGVVLIVIGGAGIAHRLALEAVPSGAAPSPGNGGRWPSRRSRSRPRKASTEYTVRAARRSRSGLLEANAWHARSDAASSVVVIVGVGGALLGLGYLDALAAVAVSWMIGRMGYRLARRSVEELIDTGLEPEQVEAIRGALMEVDGSERPPHCCGPGRWGRRPSSTSTSFSTTRS